MNTRKAFGLTWAIALLCAFAQAADANAASAVMSVRAKIQKHHKIDASAWLADQASAPKLVVTHAPRQTEGAPEFTVLVSTDDEVVAGFDSARSVGSHAFAIDTQTNPIITITAQYHLPTVE